MTSGKSTPTRGFSFDVMRPLAKDNQGSAGKDGKEAWEINDGQSSMGESCILFLATVFCDGKNVDLTLGFLSGWLEYIYPTVLSSPSANLLF
jgi:hypothetical protein